MYVRITAWGSGSRLEVSVRDSGLKAMYVRITAWGSGFRLEVRVRDLALR